MRQDSWCHAAGLTENGSLLSHLIAYWSRKSWSCTALCCCGLDLVWLTARIQDIRLLIQKVLPSLVSPFHLGINPCLHRSAHLGSLTQTPSPPVCLHCFPSWTSCPLLPVSIALSPGPSMEGHSISDCWINFVAYARNDTTASGSDRYFIIWWGIKRCQLIFKIIDCSFMMPLSHLISLQPCRALKLLNIPYNQR